MTDNVSFCRVDDGRLTACCDFDRLGFHCHCLLFSGRLFVENVSITALRIPAQ